MTASRAPQWTAGMRPRHWYRISGDAPDLALPCTPAGTRYLADNDPARDPHLNPPRATRERVRRALGREPRAPWSGHVGLPAMTEAWNSAVFASGFGACGSMIVFGGGHADYYGADVHAFDLDSRRWSRIHDGWVSGAPSRYGAGARYADACYPNGSPLPPHTYDYVQYDAAGNDYLLVKGQLELGEQVEAVAIPHLFNFEQRRWRHGPPHPDANLNSGGFTTWDASRRLLWVHSGDDGGGNAFTAYAPDGDNGDGSFGRWHQRHDNKLPGIANHNAMAMLPALDLIVVASHACNRLGVIDPDSPQAPVRWLTTTGDAPPLAPYCALQYAPSRHALVYCSPRDGGALYAIDPPDVEKANATSAPWRWQRIDSADRSLDPFDDAARVSRHAVNRDHLFGRLRIASYDDADHAIVVLHVDSPVYAMRIG